MHDNMIFLLLYKGSSDNRETFNINNIDDLVKKNAVKTKFKTKLCVSIIDLITFGMHFKLQCV